MKNLFAILIALTTLLSCSKDDPQLSHSELITSFKIVLIANDLSDAIIIEHKDLDGPDGPQQPFSSTVVLRANTTYDGTMEILNHNATPTENLKAEIVSEGVDHQVFFQTNSINLSVEYMDEDASGMPIGIQSRFKVGEAGQGKLKIQIKHQPEKNMEGDSDRAGGTIDIEGEFDVIIV